jgi:hypothetical protein
MQDFITQNVRTSAILTTGYVAGTVIGPLAGDPVNKNQLTLLVDFTIGSLTTAEIKIEFSTDGSNYYQEVTETVSGGIVSVNQAYRQLGATGQYRIALPIKESYIRVSAKGTGTVTSSLMAIKAILGTV